MNTKSSKRHKCAVSNKSKNCKNGDAEVFVLPPNILEKLGIQLGDIQQTQECPSKSNNFDLGAIQSKHIEQSKQKEKKHKPSIPLTSEKSLSNVRESSILETATLMKESVFLSPTFVPTVANAIDGEVEIANGIKESDKTTNDEFGIEPNLVDSFDIEQIMNSNNENGVIEFAEKILQSNEKKEDKKETNINEFNEIIINTGLVQQEIIAEKCNVPTPSSEIVTPNKSVNTTVAEPQLCQVGLSTDIDDVRQSEQAKESCSSVCKNDQIVEIQVFVENINNCEKISLDDLDIKERIGDALLESEIESFQADFLDSISCKFSANMVEVNVTRPPISVNKVENKIKNKIQILSQEVVDFKNLDRKIASPLNTNNLIPVTIDSIISTRNLISNLEENDQNKQPVLNAFNLDQNMTSNWPDKDLDIKKVIFEKHSKQGILNSNNEVINNNSDKSISYLSVSTESNVEVNMPDHDLKDSINIIYTNDVEISEENQSTESKMVLNISSSNFTSATQSNLILKDQIIDITPKLNDENKRKNKYLPSLATAKRMKGNGNQLLYGPSKTKSCVHGVEKPGGDELVGLEHSVNVKGLKTYQRIKKITSSEFHFSEKGETINVTTNNEIINNFNENTVVNSANGIGGYCLCNDFGRLTNYDESDVFAHIHFMQSETVTSDPDIIYSIYCEDTIQIDHSECITTDVELIQEKQTTPICWQAISAHRREIVYESLSTSRDETENSFTKTQSDISSIKLNQALNEKQEQQLNSNIKVNKEVLLCGMNIEENKETAVNSDQRKNLITVYTTQSNNNAEDVLKTEEFVSKIKTATLKTTSTVVENLFDGKNDTKNNQTTNTHIATTIIADREEEERGTETVNNIVSKNLKSPKHVLATFGNDKQKSSYYAEKQTNQSSSTKVLHYQTTNVINSIKNVVDIDISKDNSDKDVYKTESEETSNRTVKNEALERIQEVKLDEKNCERNTKDRSPEIVVDSSESYEKYVCGVCDQLVSKDNWNDHVALTHHYIAWKVGERLDLDNYDVLDNLAQRFKENGVLACSICGNFKINCFATFILHLKMCMKAKDSAHVEINKKIKCGVCKCHMQLQTWYRHLIQHNYLAWKDGDPVLDLNNKETVERHLYKLSIKLGDLKCKCGKRHKIVQNFLSHLTVCKGQLSDEETEETIKCGVCKETMDRKLWNEHIKKHDYLAWVYGECPIDFEDETDLWRHLCRVARQIGVLICQKCGKELKNAKKYLDHINTCKQLSDEETEETIKCGVCKETMDRKLWNEHIKKHDYLAWVDGETPLDFECETDLWRHLCRVARQIGVLICQKCGKERKRAKKYLDHINKCKLEIPITDCEHSLMSPDVNLDTSMSTKLKSSENLEMQELSNNPQISEDLGDENAILQHLKKIISECSILVCKKCGLHRKYAKAFMNHINYCDGSGSSANTCLATPLNTTLEFNTTVEGSRLDSDSSRRESTDNNVRPGRRRKRARISSFSDEDNVVLSKRRSVVARDTVVMCGVCKMEVQESMWYIHIGKEHHYLAWKEGETPLNVEDEKTVCCHLLSISNTLNKLVCYKCNYARRKPKSFLDHVKKCTVTGEANDDSSMLDVADANSDSQNMDIKPQIDPRGKIVEQEMVTQSDVTCAVCKMTVVNSSWIEHIKQEHNYLAWREEGPFLDLEREDAVWDHLRAISKKQNGLVCNKCGVVKKYPKMFLKHVHYCTGPRDPESNNYSSIVETDVSVGDGVPDQVTALTSDADVSKDLDVAPLLATCVKKEQENEKAAPAASGPVTCAVCKMSLKESNWIEHIKQVHNYLAWTEGQPDLDFENEDAVRDHLRAISKKHNGLVCNKCGAVNKYPKNFLKHVHFCMETEDKQSHNDSSIVDDLIICGVCSKKIRSQNWTKHIQIAHNYLVQMKYTLH